MNPLIWMMIDLAALGAGSPITEPSYTVAYEDEPEGVEVVIQPADEVHGVWRCIGKDGRMFVYGGPRHDGLEILDCVDEFDVIQAHSRSQD